MKNLHLTCPVCGGEVEDTFDICETCGWEYDDYQEVEPDDTGANGKLTLNEAKKLWEASDKNDPNFFVKYMRQGYCCSEGRCSMENLTIEEIEERMDAENPETNSNGNETKFFEYALMGAKQGSAKCMAGVSLCYFMAYGTEFDEEEAIKWAEKGVAQGNDMAVFLRGTYYEYGNGIYQNFEKALTFYKMAAALDYPRAKGYLACMYADGICCEVDHNKAFELWMEAYDDGEVWCSAYLFECYLYGLGTKKDLQKAEKYLTVAQKNNEEIDSNSIAKYENEIKMSKQIKPDKTDKFLSDEEFAEAFNELNSESQLCKKGKKKSLANKRFVLPGREELTKYFNDVIIDFFKYKEKYNKMGITTVPATLLYGPPGCGKTHAVAALTKFLGMPVFEVNSLTVGSIYVHGTAEKIAKIFEAAKKAAPSVVVIDEFETFVGKRNADDWESKIEETDEFLRNISPAIDKGVVIFAMTNMREMIDPAILRKGRFDNQIEVGPAGLEEIKAVLKSELAKTEANPKLDLDSFTQKLINRPLSDVGYVVRQAIRSAVHNDHSKVETSDLNNGYNDLVRGEMKHVNVPHRHIGFQTA